MRDRSTWKASADALFRRVGLRAEPRYHMLDRHRQALLRAQRITRVLDVGANVGQYASSLRRDGYTGEIVSFEANPVAASPPGCHGRGRRRWRVEAVALGAVPGLTRLHSPSTP